MQDPSENLVTRQHDETEVPEVYGIPCQVFHACYKAKDPVDVGWIYLKLDQTWHGFYLDGGRLHWQEGQEPRPDVDLADGEDYVDWGTQLGVIGVPLTEVSIASAELTLRFQNGAEVVLRDYGIFFGTTSVLRFVPGK